jgi:uncharacterized protein YecT (DUF1311 family)
MHPHLGEVCPQGLVSQWMALPFWLLLVLPAQAAQSPEEAACIAGEAPTQSACLEKLAKIADDKLNKTYREAGKKIDENGNGEAAAWKAELREAQRAWVAFRNADCGDLIIHEWGQGTGMGSAIESCLLHKTEQRTRELIERYIDRR